jgi:hypothetical protein
LEGAHDGEVTESRRQHLLELVGWSRHWQGLKKQITPTEMNSNKVATSKNDPEYTVKRDKPEKIAAHKPNGFNKA